MLASQAWIIGTPIYMGQASGQLKLLLDRMYGFTGPNKEKRIPPGKKAIVAVTQAASEESHVEVPKQMKAFFTRRGLDTEVIRACNMPTAAPSPQFGPEICEEARRLGKWLSDEGNLQEK
jgi:NAD(P)H-dependent FMN reductase